MPQHPAPINAVRFRTTIKMAISKLQFIQEKKAALTKQQRRQLADLLSSGKESSAKIRVENIIRDDISIELLEYLELYCELILARLSLIIDNPTCEESLLEAVYSVIYSAPHSELKELTQLRELLIYKFGPEFGKKAIENDGGHVPEKILKRCRIPPPSEELVNLYLCEIAKTYGAPYSGLKDLVSIDDDEKGADSDDHDDPSSGVGVQNLEKPIAEPEEPAKKPKEVDELDALKARFAALKR
ncbi:Vacuolar protein sorting-associated protein ist1 [Yamadazyma tenuis]|uniref:DUF292-domain-containing protein n=1 Tax=Candida tenuis (strain ATCC 10573 / BCRC 21748 / CBS 615 / JCM 9827 / NBRC 10315 / NRRL Y-1498 / VKM Y-70) TaxID=590646 RepID=G3B7P6_CANTC|nr:DUF292-domain-containing protein [Yamadazyma tenuis ATCC 10573]XP_006689010.1 uncharacterized protein CANTEDRAFT_115753 [Yamadazyma tenuis ATCC 10573]EGV62839.1 DUF292-domain-containing protein [Yamadazyma tenuis ATCC 10573]EGV62840.1 hypothetical protein CANTEDRAFT_115753 [Yamadazyma tenuis ATCC 10573]WEJ93543.1 Vacuolar protein sorting-associated protein ist1 [Yamadazyma tenuis]